MSITENISFYRMLIVKIRSSPQRQEKFSTFAENSRLPPLDLLVDVRTRWNSTFMMIERALVLRQPLDDIATLIPELTIYRLNDEEWRLLGILCTLLERFFKASNYFSGEEYPTLTASIPGYNYLIDRLEDAKTQHKNEAIILAAIEAALRKLLQYYVLADADVYPIATILDPRVKMEYYKFYHWGRKFINEAKNTFERIYQIYQQLYQVAESEDQMSSEPENEIMAHMFKRQRTTTWNELSGYLNSPVVPKKTKPLDWWRANESEYPCLAAMARDYLGIPATSAPIERVFSTGADLVHPKRNGLSEDTIKTVMCLKSWLKKKM
jgi:hAT family C-terminal dimerisation region